MCDLPVDFNWKLYLHLNKDLKENILTKEKCISHYLKYGAKEKRKYKISDTKISDTKITDTKISDTKITDTKISDTKITDTKITDTKISDTKITDTKITDTNILPHDFNWETYLDLNKDLKEKISTKEKGISHYLKHGIKEKRKYKNPFKNFNDAINKIITDENKMYYDLNLFKIFMYTLTFNINNLDDESINYKDVIEFNDINYNSPVDSYSDTNNKISQKYLFYNESKMNETDIKNKYINIVNEKIVNIYDSFIVIFDLPLYFLGGTKTFIKNIINYYQKYTCLLIIRKCENGINKIHINDEFTIDKSYNDGEIFSFLNIHTTQIKKIFINHNHNFKHKFIQQIASLKKEMTGITHDHTLVTDDKVQLLYHEIIKYENKANLSIYDNIIIQNINNLYILDDTNVKKITLSILPDFSEPNELIVTTKLEIVIGIIGNISDIKGLQLLSYIAYNYKNVNFIVFGKCINLICTDNIKCYSYDNIRQLNELLKIHKPNMFLELSLWPETYSYVLTIYQIINLPIAVLKKKFQSTIENRLLEYSKTFYFDSLKELEIIMYNQKQNYLYTINPVVYFNDFWDNYFCKTESICKNILHTNKTEHDDDLKVCLENTYNKNIVLITSKIYVSDNIFSYVNERSIYSQTERMSQTIKTIDSIRMHIPDSYIVLFDNSEFSPEELELLNNNVDYFINITNNEILNYYTNICEYKCLSDLYQQIFSYHVFFKHIDFKKIKQFYKISGRYFINHSFNFELFNNDYTLFKQDINITDRLYYYTCFYKISITHLNFYFDKMINIFKNKELFYEKDLENIFAHELKDIITLLNATYNIGITQIFSCWNKIIDI